MGEMSMLELAHSLGRGCRSKAWLDEPATIYAVQALRTGLIKIGRTRQPRARYAQIRKAVEGPVELLWETVAPPELERELHIEYRALRAKERTHGSSEWFTPSEEMLVRFGLDADERAHVLARRGRSA